MIIITNENLLVTPDIETDKKTKISDSELPSYLSDDVTFSDDLTFERLFNLIILHKDLFNKIFYKTLSGFKIDDFIDDFNGEPTGNINDYHLTISPISDLYKNELSISYSFGGYDDDTKTSYSIALTPLKEYRGRNIKIRDLFIVYDYENENGVVEILKTKLINFKLFDVIYAILYEISWYGLPNDRKKVSDDLDKSLEEISEYLNDGTIYDKSIPWEKFKIDINDSLIEKYVENEEYEKAHELKIENEKLRNILEEKEKNRKSDF